MIAKATYLYEMGIMARTKDKHVKRFLSALPKDNMRIKDNSSKSPIAVKSRTPMAKTRKTLLFNRPPRNIGSRQSSLSSFGGGGVKTNFIRQHRKTNNTVPTPSNKGAPVIA